jgi:pimeloyl-[acyl-carrier protein] methyl ester esterase
MTPRLYSEQFGSGPLVVLVHGWALHGGIWDAVTNVLAERFTVRRVDLPGHGRSPLMGGLNSIEAVADGLAKVAPGGASWIGWSLGGMACIELAARRPELVRRLVLVSATPSFVAREGWQSGQTSETLAAFSRDLASDFRGAVYRFLSLQVRGDAHSREVLRDLRARVTSRGMPTRLALEKGMQLLRQTDLRDRVDGIAAPTLIVKGGRDRLTHPAASDWLAERIRNARGLAIDDAGHAPFLTHPGVFCAAVGRFLSEGSEAAT